MESRKSDIKTEIAPLLQTRKNDKVFQRTWQPLPCSCQMNQPSEDVARTASGLADKKSKAADFKETVYPQGSQGISGKNLFRHLEMGKELSFCKLQVLHQSRPDRTGPVQRCSRASHSVLHGHPTVCRWSRCRQTERG